MEGAGGARGTFFSRNVGRILFSRPFCWFLPQCSCERSREREKERERVGGCVCLLAAFGSGFGLPLQLGLGCGYRSFFLPLQGLSLSLSEE